MLFNYHPRFQIWGKDYVRPNLAGCARAEPFKRRKKMSTAKVRLQQTQLLISVSRSILADGLDLAGKAQKSRE